MMAADFLFKESQDSPKLDSVLGKETNFVTLLKLQVLVMVNTGGTSQRQPIESGNTLD